MRAPRTLLGALSPFPSRMLAPEHTARTVVLAPSRTTRLWRSLTRLELHPVRRILLSPKGLGLAAWLAAQGYPSTMTYQDVSVELGVQADTAYRAAAELEGLGALTFTRGKVSQVTYHASWVWTAVSELLQAGAK